MARAFQISLTIFMCLIMLPMTAHAEDQYSAEEISLIENGKPFVSVKAGRNKDGVKAAQIRGAIDIEAPVEVVWNVMIDCPNAPKIVPKLKKCEVLEEEKADDGELKTDIRRHVFSLSRLFPKTRNEFQTHYVTHEEIAFDRVGGDLKVMQGVWRFEELPEQNKTRLYYQSQLATSLPIPGFALRRSLNKDTPRILKSVKNESERIHNTQP